MITRRLSIMLGVTMATAGMALLAPVSGAMARGGGSNTNGSFPTGPNQNLNGGNSSSGGNGSGSTHGPFPTGPNQNLNGGNSSSGSSGRGSGNGGHGLPPGSGSGGGGKPPSGGGGRPGQ